MNKIPFFKMTGCGNDFIIIDNRTGIWNHLKTPSFVKAVCRRNVSVGADGLIFVDDSDRHDFSWRFFNSDGSEAEMCGNGGRCAARFAFLNGIAGSNMSFETVAGVIRAEVDGSTVKIQLPEPMNQEMDIKIDLDGRYFTVHSINTGVPHAVLFVEDIENIEVKQIGSKIRFHKRFQPAGTNVNFVSQIKKNMLNIRTYERGVEDETLACGTGSVAAALVAISMGKAVSPVDIMTRGGEALKVFAGQSCPPFKEVYLAGGARVLCKGEIWEEAFM
jgi:diaminopimelate epimerase